MESLQREILKLYPAFDQSVLQDGLKQFELKKFKAKDYALNAGKVCDHLFFATKSIVKCYSLTPEGENHVLWMKPEQTFFTEYKSFVNRDPSIFNLQFYEDTEVYCIHRNALLNLYAASTDWALFGVHLTEAVHVTLIEVFVNLLANDATRNYQYIEYMFPRFIQVAPLKDIASMLKVSPVSLSRIRAGTQTKS